jgi:DNA repair protein RadC
MEIREYSDDELKDEWFRRFNLPEGTIIKNASEAVNHLRHFFADARDKELFVMIYLSSKNSVLGTAVLFEGSVQSSAIYPREILKSVLLEYPGTAGVIICHNHPSGQYEPSGSDKTITRKLKSALESVDIDLLDHLILGKEFYSFADHNML